MSIFSIFKSRDKPQNRIAGSSYNFLFGGSDSGKSVNERSAMQMTAVYECVRILSEAIAGWPLYLYRSDMDGSRKKAPIPRFRYRISVRLTMPVCSYYVTDTAEESI